MHPPSPWAASFPWSWAFSAHGPAPVTTGHNLGRPSGIESRTQLPAQAASAAEARRVALSALAQWDLSRFGDTVSLLVTELISNGVRHARTTLELILSFDGACLRIAVADGDPRPPVVRARRGLTPGGWGLALVDSLSTGWGTDMAGARGKTVWFEIDTTAPGHRPWSTPTTPPERRPGR